MFEIIETFKLFRKLSTDEKGVTTLEYGLIAAVIGTVVITLGPKFTTLFTEVFDKLSLKVAGS